MAANGTGGTVYRPGGAPKKNRKSKRPANQHAGSGVAHPPGKPYQWANGSFHTRKQGARFRSNHQGHGRNGGGGESNSSTGGVTAPNQPKPVDPLTRLASRYGNMAYGQTLGAINQDLANVQPYFQNFINDVNASNATYTAQAQPLLQGAQQQQQIAGQLAPGTEQSPEAQLAAQSRDALAGLGLTALQGIVSANQGYFAGQAGPVAAAGRLQIQSQLGQEKRQVLREKGNYVATKREDLRQTRHKEKLENAAFGLDVQQEQNKQANNAANRRQKNRQARLNRQAQRQAQRGAQRVAGRKDRANFIAKYGIPPEDVRDGLTPAERRQMQQYQDSGGGMTPAQRRAQHRARGKAINRVNEIPGAWKDYSKSTNRVPVYNPDGTQKVDINGNPVTKVVSPTPAQIRSQLRKDGYSRSEIRLAEAIQKARHTHTPLPGSMVRLAKRLGIWPLPNGWRVKAQKPPRPGVAPVSPTTGKAPY